jgi:geranylgeranyl diphosphate synthase type I
MVGLTLVSPSDLQSLDRHLAGRLTRLLDDAAPADGLSPMNDRLRRYVQRGGKRFRPQLCLWAFDRAGGSREADGAPPAAVLDVACAWELFHAFLLVHDDLIDAADTRRSMPSLHRQMQSLDHDGEQFGRNLAIVAGDLLFGVAFRLVAEADAPPAVRCELMQLFARVACTTGFGQAIDVLQAEAPLSAVTEATLLREYHWKTAAYTFEGPLVAGATLAGASPATLNGLAGFARTLGQAYQLQNDLADLSVPAHDGCDLVQGKRTPTLLRARATLPAEGREGFDRRVDAVRTANGRAVELAERLRREVSDSGALEQTARLVRDLLADARAAVPAVTPRLASALAELVDGLETTYFAPVPTA